LWGFKQLAAYLPICEPLGEKKLQADLCCELERSIQPFWRQGLKSVAQLSLFRTPGSTINACISRFIFFSLWRGQMKTNASKEKQIAQNPSYD